MRKPTKANLVNRILSCQRTHRTQRTILLVQLATAMPNDPPVYEPRSDELPQDISAFLKYPFLGRPRLRSDMNSGEFNGKLQRAQSNSKIYLIHLNWVIAEVS